MSEERGRAGRGPTFEGSESFSCMTPAASVRSLSLSLSFFPSFEGGAGAAAAPTQRASLLSFPPASAGSLSLSLFSEYVCVCLQF